MAKKPEKEEPWVRCEDCKKSIGKVENHLIGCSDLRANPGGYMMGNYPRKCNDFVKK
jgi:hypothetical protein